jgi:hypothetical protein
MVALTGQRATAENAEAAEEFARNRECLRAERLARGLGATSLPKRDPPRTATCDSLLLERTHGGGRAAPWAVNAGP